MAKGSLHCPLCIWTCEVPWTGWVWICSSFQHFSLLQGVLPLTIAILYSTESLLDTWPLPRQWNATFLEEEKWCSCRTSREITRRPSFWSSLSSFLDTQASRDAADLPGHTFSGFIPGALPWEPICSSRLLLLVIHSQTFHLCACPCSCLLCFWPEAPQNPAHPWRPQRNVILQFSLIL